MKLGTKEYDYSHKLRISEKARQYTIRWFGYGKRREDG